MGVDLFSLHEVDYLLVVDYMSKWPIVKRLPLTTSTAVIHAMGEVFADWGTPEFLVSDNGPQF